MIAKAELIRKVDRLTPFSSAILQLMQALNDPESDVRSIVAALRFDPAITVQVLRLCNSAAFGRPRKVTSLAEAVVYLGRRRLLEVLLQVGAGMVLDGNHPGYGLSRGQLWKHSVAVALAAEALGSRLGMQDSSALFTAGLLHDVGKIVLSEYVAPAFRKILARVEQQSATFFEAEHELLGYSHDEVGAMLAERWKLPEPIVRCIRYHYRPSELNPADPLVDVVNLANCLCLMFGVGTGEDGLNYRADPLVMKRVGAHRSDLSAVEVEVAVRLRELSPLFAETPEECPARV